MSQKQECKVFIGGLSWETTGDKLRSYFENYGVVKEAFVSYNRANGKPRGFGFVVFETTEVADKVVAAKHTIDRREVEAKRAIPKDCVFFESEMKPLSEGPLRPRKVFVGGLPASVDEVALRQYFQQFGKILDSVVMYDHENKRPRGFGFITFADEEALERVFKKGTVHLILDKPVEIKAAVPKDLMTQGGSTLPVNSGLTAGLASNLFLGQTPSSLSLSQQAELSWTFTSPFQRDMGSMGSSDLLLQAASLDPALFQTAPHSMNGYSGLDYETLASSFGAVSSNIPSQGEALSLSLANMNLMGDMRKGGFAQAGFPLHSGLNSDAAGVSNGAVLLDGHLLTRVNRQASGQAGIASGLLNSNCNNITPSLSGVHGLAAGSHHPALSLHDSGGGNALEGQANSNLTNPNVNLLANAPQLMAGGSDASSGNPSGTAQSSGSSLSGSMVSHLQKAYNLSQYMERANSGGSLSGVGGPYQHQHPHPHQSSFQTATNGNVSVNVGGVLKPMHTLFQATGGAYAADEVFAQPGAAGLSSNRRESLSAASRQASLKSNGGSGSGFGGGIMVSAGSDGFVTASRTFSRDSPSSTGAPSSPTRGGASGNGNGSGTVMAAFSKIPLSMLSVGSNGGGPMNPTSVLGSSLGTLLNSANFGPGGLANQSVNGSYLPGSSSSTLLTSADFGSELDELSGFMSQRFTQDPHGILGCSGNFSNGGTSSSSNSVNGTANGSQNAVQQALMSWSSMADSFNPASFSSSSFTSSSLSSYSHLRHMGANGNGNGNGAAPVVSPSPSYSSFPTVGGNSQFESPRSSAKAMQNKAVFGARESVMDGELPSGFFMQQNGGGAAYDAPQSMGVGMGVLKSASAGAPSIPGGRNVSLCHPGNRRLHDSPGMSSAADPSRLHNGSFAPPNTANAVMAAMAHGRQNGGLSRTSANFPSHYANPQQLSAGAGASVGAMLVPGAAASMSSSASALNNNNRLVMNVPLSSLQYCLWPGGPA